jgi:hypothetical protein
MINRFTTQIVILLCISLLSIELAEAQIGRGGSRGYRFRSNARGAQHWWEVSGAVGITNFLGEVGGSPDIGTNFSKDMNFRASRPAFQIGAKYFYIPRLAQKLNLSYGWVNGDDYFTSQYDRNYRNLNFRSPIFEFSTQLEVYIIKEGKRGSRYKLAGIKAKKSNPMEMYLFGGIGGFYFNPKGKIPEGQPGAGEWVALQPLNTEGQGAVPGRNPYSRVSMCFPLGVGLTFRLSELFKLGIEAGARYTLTDYIDDVSTTYVGLNYLSKTPSENKALTYIMADKSDFSIPAKTAPGQQRGDPRDRDMYMFFMINVHYKLGGGGRGTIPKFF